MSKQSAPPAFIHTERYKKFDYGKHHPLRIARLGLTRELIGLVGLDETYYDFPAATMEDLAEFHDRYYLETLKELSETKNLRGFGSFGLGPGDNPIFPGVYEWSTLMTGASLKAAQMVVEEKRPAAFSMAGGMHHGLAARASGFCYVNDPVLVIKRLLQKDLRVVYLDLDAHHGDGVQWAFYETDQVMTISLHQHPATLFPGTGYIEEQGRGKGRGYSVNIPLWPDTEDEIYIRCFDSLVPDLIQAFNPDYLVTQLGVDALLTDPLANLNLTTRGLAHCMRAIKEMAWGRWIALGGGGYNVVNVARVWTMLWAIMMDEEDKLPEHLPQEFSDNLRLPKDERRLLDPQELIRGRFWKRAGRDADDVIELVRKEIFPVHGI
ncbi:acetoin utilization protein AcuC [Dethiosulfatarculus sandiegensis]|uniref:Acetoin utilization protein AcuC n=1 Tax=Dethiosulfatarculus sandiegensis TaxID=1429043 RepID=A0A0D2K0V2_9BACT|nr:acetoin utilization protein AcuC [Dethiosulfatarculus sandiegensis]KIX15350.1 histone deacetylase [Dethiosulfatarculus sandiegensis]